jgi:DMSO/TMAO reductase YedYZ molybdopterin-dependent catalytic subunit
MTYPGTWSGPVLSDVLKRQGVEGDFQELRIVAWDGYVAHVASDIAMRPDTILAFEQDGAAIPEEDGPVRLVVGSQDGFYWIRMITRIEIVR